MKLIFSKTYPFKIFLILLFSCLSICNAQIYDLPECIEIALERKRTLVSADLDVQSATKQVIGSYSGVLPSVSFSTNGGKTKYPNQESIVQERINISYILYLLSLIQK